MNKEFISRSENSEDEKDIFKEFDAINQEMIVKAKEDMVKLVDVSVELDGRYILKDINLTVKRGEILVIIGSSGSGKSTLLKLIIGLLKPTSGQIWIDGKNITMIHEDDLNEIRLKMGMVFQYSALFDSMSIGDNVAFGLKEHTDLDEAIIKKIVTEKLGLVDLKGIEDNMPNTLSGGMKKRVGLARAIAIDPQIVLYDEPTSGLDPINSQVIDELIVSTKKAIQATAIVVTHDIKSAFTISDRIAMLHEGNFVIMGTPEEVKKSKNPFVQNFINGFVT